MQRLRYILYIVVTMVGASLWVGCNTSGCLENRSSIPLAGFYSSATGGAISIDSLIIIGIGISDGAPLYDGESPISSAYLPMRATADTTSWEIEYRIPLKINDSITVSYTMYDTLAFGYTTSPYFASSECGVIYRYQIKHFSYTKHLIDSVVILDSLITNIDTERLKIYFRTSQAENDTD